MELKLIAQVAPQAEELLALADLMAGPVERSRRAGFLDFETATDLAAMFDRARSLTIDYLHTVGRAEGRKPYLVELELPRRTA